MPPKKLDLAGRRFGRLIVIDEAGRNQARHVTWLCRCDCGATVIRVGSNLKRGKVTSCGCLPNPGHFLPAHGQEGTPLYRRWQAMMTRTTNPNHPAFHNYGGRGIRVCDRWLSFTNFATDMGPSFQVHLTLDRIDTNGPYEPNNCRWITNAQQQRNRRNNHRLTCHGRSMTLVEWTEVLALPRSTIEYRLKHGWTVQRALTKGVAPETLASLPDA